jgi:soluble lytic murein transglycosylase-like protein
MSRFLTLLVLCVVALCLLVVAMGGPTILTKTVRVSSLALDDQPTSAPVHGTKAYYTWLARNAAQEVGIDPTIFANQINEESGFDPSATGCCGEVGIAQFLPSTAAGLGLDPHDPVASLRAAAQMDARRLALYGGDWAKTLAAYNCGGGCVASAIAQGGNQWEQYIPASTRDYIAAILGR